jgi:hypothetical protein
LLPFDFPLRCRIDGGNFWSGKRTANSVIGPRADIHQENVGDQQNAESAVQHGQNSLTG